MDLAQAETQLHAIAREFEGDQTAADAARSRCSRFHE